MPQIAAAMTADDTNVSCESAPDFTSEGTESTETDRKERRVQTRIRNHFFPASEFSVPSVVKTPDRASGRRIPGKGWLAPMPLQLKHVSPSFICRHEGD